MTDSRACLPACCRPKDFTHLPQHVHTPSCRSWERPVEG